MSKQCEHTEWYRRGMWKTQYKSKNNPSPGKPKYVYESNKWYCLNCDKEMPHKEGDL